MSIQAVAFDYGGVICFPPSEESLQELGHLTGLSPMCFAELNRKFRLEYDRGVYTGVEYFHSILSGAGIFLDEASLERIAQTELNGWKRINPDTVQLMRDVKSSGIKLAILSNIPVDLLAWAVEQPVFTEADVGIYSCEHKLVKPEKGIYEKLKEQLNLEYAEIVFFDDKPENIDTARELGMNGFVWENPACAREILNTYCIFS